MVIRFAGGHLIRKWTLDPQVELGYFWCSGFLVLLWCSYQVSSYDSLLSWCSLGGIPGGCVGSVPP
jgi:hypothetical protein